MKNYSKSKFSCSFLLAILVSVNLFSQNTDRDLSTMCSPKIMSYFMGLEPLSIPDRVSTLVKLKLNGILIRVDKNNLADIDSYYNTKEVKDGTFHVYDLYTNIEVDATDAELINEYNDLKSICAEIQNRETVLQVIFGGTASKARITQIVSEAADIAKIYGKELIDRKSVV